MSASVVELASLGSQDVLTEVLRRWARSLLAQAVEAEVEAWIEDRAGIVDDEGHRQVVRNGHVPARKILTAVGPVEVSNRR